MLEISIFSPPPLIDDDDVLPDVTVHVIVSLVRVHVEHHHGGGEHQEILLLVSLHHSQVLHTPGESHSVRKLLHWFAES